MMTTEQKEDTPLPLVELYKNIKKYKILPTSVLRKQLYASNISMVSKETKIATNTLKKIRDFSEDYFSDSNNKTHRLVTLVMLSRYFIKNFLTNDEDDIKTFQLWYFSDFYSWYKKNYDSNY